MKIRILARQDVEQAVSMAQAIDAVKGAFAHLSAGQATVPLRTQLPVPGHHGVALFMPAYLQDSDALAVKIVSVFPDNAQRGLPTIHALVVVSDASTGQPVAVLDGIYLTALRTGAASGAATDLLARPDAQRVAIFGAGTQGRTQLLAVCTVRQVTHVSVYDSVRTRAEQFASEMRSRDGIVPQDINVVESPVQAVADADIICTATTSTTPVFPNRALKAGVHINAIGAYTPEMQEVDEATVARARIVVDSREACLAEAGDLIIPLHKGLISESDIHAELGEVVLGTRPGRETSDQVTLFKTVGNAVQDVAVSRLALRAALEKDLGAEIDL